MRHLLVSLLVTASGAWAADGARGFTVFTNACATCHTARYDAVERAPRQAPDLVWAVKKKDGAQLNAWILEPETRRVKDSPCDTRALREDRAALADVWAWLQGQLDAPPAARTERRRREMQGVDLTRWRNRKKGANR